MGTIGIIVNPASGKDVRRLVARASVFDNREKQAIVRRALTGIAALGSANSRIVYLDDTHGITRGALADVGARLAAEPVPTSRSASGRDTTSAARAMRERGCRVVLTLGGDGTNRDVAIGWQNAPLIAISTGTNNVFPGLVEGTVAGAAAGLIGGQWVDVDEVASQCKTIRAEIDDEPSDLALIDAAHSSERFVGSRALLDADALRSVLLTRADPAAVGMTALGGLLEPLDDAQAGGLLVRLAAEGAGLTLPIAPGYYQTVRIAECRRVGFGETVTVRGPGVLAFDGERTRALGPGRAARLRVERTGPRVIDVARTLELGALRGAFRTPTDPEQRR